MKRARPQSSEIIRITNLQDLKTYSQTAPAPWFYHKPTEQFTHSQMMWCEVGLKAVTQPIQGWTADVKGILKGLVWGKREFIGYTLNTGHFMISWPPQGWPLAKTQPRIKWCGRATFHQWGPKTNLSINLLSGLVLPYTSKHQCQVQAGRLWCCCFFLLQRNGSCEAD